MNLTETEPVGIAGALILFVNGAIGLAQIFGLVHWSADQVAQIAVVINSIAIFVSLLWARFRVFAPATIAGQAPAELDYGPPLSAEKAEATDLSVDPSAGE
jgi:hypothetical protein